MNISTILIILRDLFLGLVLVSCSFRQPVVAPATQTRTNIPAFDTIVWIVLENRDYADVIGNKKMPYLNELAKNNVILSNYHAIRHPSLPNYLALVGGSTFGVRRNCRDCFVDEPNLADEIEKSGRTWKTYQEDMPGPCFVGDKGEYVQKHNPFIYFDSIRLNMSRCEKSIVPLDRMERDLANNSFPDFVLITPNLCNSGHDCKAGKVDAWLKQTVDLLQKSPALGDRLLIVITYDEAGDKDTESCCGLGKKAGGRVATILISPQAKAGFIDPTPYSHYSLLKTVLQAWKLPDLGATKDPETAVITAPWK